MAEQASTHQGSSATKRIWYVFGILSVVTLVEVVLGIIKPAFMVDTEFIDLHLLNWTFIILTIVKAYYITWAFMHMEHESSGLRRAVVCFPHHLPYCHIAYRRWLYRGRLHRFPHQMEPLIEMLKLG